MDETQKLPVDDLFLAVSENAADCATVEPVVGKARAKRLRAVQPPTELLGVLGEDDEACTAEEEAEIAEFDSARNPPKKKSRATHKALTAVLAGQPGTLRLSGGGVADELDERSGMERETTNENSSSGRPLLAVDSESGESGAVKANATVGKGEENAGKMSSDSQQEDSERQRVSLSPQAITTTSSTLANKGAVSLASVARGRKPVKRLGALAVPTNTVTRAALSATYTSKDDVPVAASNWVEVLRGHHSDSNSTSRRRKDSAASFLYRTSDMSRTATAMGEGKLSKSVADRENTETFLETLPQLQEVCPLPFRTVNRAASPRDRALDSPVLIPQSHHQQGLRAPTTTDVTASFAIALHQSGDGQSGKSDAAPTASSGAMAREQVPLHTPSLRPTSPAEGALLGVSPASGGSPQPFEDVAQTLAVYDLSLRPEDDGEDEEEGAPHDESSRSYRCAQRDQHAVLSEGRIEGGAGAVGVTAAQTLPETLDDGCYKGGGVAAREAKDKSHTPSKKTGAVPIGTKESSKGNEAAPIVEKSIDDDEETPLFAAEAPRFSRRPETESDSHFKSHCDQGEVDVLGKEIEDEEADARNQSSGSAVAPATRQQQNSKKANRIPSALLTAKRQQGRPLFTVGMHVEGRWGGLWCGAVIAEDEHHGYVQIRWDEDGSLLHLKTREVRLPKGSAVASARHSENKDVKDAEHSERLKKGIRLPIEGSRRNDNSASQKAERLGDGDGTDEVDMGNQSAAGEEPVHEDARLAEPRRRNVTATSAASRNASAISTRHKLSAVAMAGGAELVEQTDMEDGIELPIFTTAAPTYQKEGVKNANQKTPAHSNRSDHTKKYEQLQQKLSDRGDDARQREGGQNGPTDSQKPLFQGISPEKHYVLVATQNIFENNADEEEDFIRRHQDSLSADRDHRSAAASARKGNPAKASNGSPVAAQVRRRLARQATPSSAPAPPLSFPVTPARGTKQVDDERGSPLTLANRTQDLQQAQLMPLPFSFPSVSVGEDYYFRLPVDPNLLQHSPQVSPALLLGRVMTVEDGSAAAASGTAQEQQERQRQLPRVALQVYEVRHVTMRQNPRTGAVEQQTTVFLGPEQAVVPVSALLFDTPVFVLSAVAMRHVYLLEDETEHAGEGQFAAQAHARATTMGAAVEDDTQQLGPRVDWTEENGPASRISSLSYRAESQDAPASCRERKESSNAGEGGADVEGNTDADSPRGSPHRRTVAPRNSTPSQLKPLPQLQQQFYGNTFPIPVPPFSRPSPQPSGIDPSLPQTLHPSGVLKEIVIGDGRPVREGMTVAFRHPHAFRTGVELARSSMSDSTPLSSPNPSQQQQQHARESQNDDDRSQGSVRDYDQSQKDSTTANRWLLRNQNRSRQKKGDNDEDCILLGKVQMLRWVRGSAVLIVHTMAHNSVFGSSKMYVITPDMVLDVF